ncbi:MULTISPECIES: hypothetical protein [unclassified Burkholderia]|uniref:hypothetical protein n=1 Tax=unclassified Burkholderia TaxID=2613784 RepID=UPI000F576F0C|nr:MULTISPECIES: hypothetical protein [unclassified Burkholderia]
MKTLPVRRRPLTKTRLLPFHTDQVRRLSLKHHLPLAALCGKCGDVELIDTLSNMVVPALYLRVGGEAELYRCADFALTVAGQADASAPQP